MSIQLSPLQLMQMTFTKTQVEVFETVEDAGEFWAPQFDFEGVNLLVENTIGQQENNTTDFMVALRVAVLNEADAVKKAPYTFDIAVQGVFKLAESFTCEDRRDLVRVNGSAMLYGAIRDMLQQITARSMYGTLLLPTLHFLPESTDSKKL
ncbi:protein-export chaperone SecB [Denitrificimonas caeni]|uniref:Protein-export chaperone SecB n=1 Tax=Denitrificimonas caeni TaxID=521720 RepID=A0AAE9VRJ9_9GAMM|nr:protein-export chaperone SecB [Denitrificimonas caeni]WBE25055.1 protein-export chaperone SecB [Denitrificimonas caeni]